MPEGLTFEEARKQTHAARLRRGWAAVAPALEPYQNATHWPSGTPLPRHLLYRAAKRWRCPASVFLRTCIKSLGRALVLILQAAYVSGIIGSFIANLIQAIFKLDCRRAVWTQCGVCGAFGLVLVVMILMSGRVTRDRTNALTDTEVDRHIRLLYVLFLLHRAGAAPQDRIFRDYRGWIA